MPDENGSAPWESDVDNILNSDDPREALNDYLRSQQGRMTQLEQQAATSDDAQALWDSLSEHPQETFLSIAEQMFDPSVHEALNSALSGEQGEAAQQAAEQAVAEAVTEVPESQYAQLDPETQAILDNVKMQQWQAQYEAELEQHIDQNHDLDAELLRNNIHPFVAAAEGNIAEGVARYRAFLNEFGVPATSAEIESNAPNVMTDEGTANVGGEAPQAKKTLSQALDDWGAERLAANNPPPVGAA